MADIKISELEEANLPLDGTEDTVIVQSAVSRRCSTQDIADLAGAYTPSYKSYQAIVDLSSGTFTVRQKQNDFTGITFAWTNPQNGVINVTASGISFTTNRCVSPGSCLLAGGVAYFLIGSQLTTSIWQFDIVKHDGTQSGTPNFSQALFEIRVYNI